MHLNNIHTESTMPGRISMYILSQLRAISSRILRCGLTFHADSLFKGRIDNSISKAGFFSAMIYR